jgi:hypothetical protein
MVTDCVRRDRTRTAEMAEKVMRDMARVIAALQVAVGTPIDFGREDLYLGRERGRSVAALVDFAGVRKHTPKSRVRQQREHKKKRQRTFRDTHKT